MTARDLLLEGGLWSRPWSGGARKGGDRPLSHVDRIPIRNPLVVTNPRAFVITLEQPGGVVVSKQEVVVALAKTS